MVTDDGHLAIDPVLIDPNDPRTPDEQFKAFIDECHKRDIKVMLISQVALLLTCLRLNRN